MMPMIVKVYYNHRFLLIKESDDDSVESTMSHTQHKSLSFVCQQTEDLSLKSIHTTNTIIKQDCKQDYNEFLHSYTI
jgi:hypothetical protein